MTISSTTNTVSYTGNGSTTAFAVPYVFFGTGTTSEIQVVEVVIATGAETVKSNGSDYTVAGGSGTTGTVTAATAPASTVKWVINRATTQTQETDYVENDPFPAESHEEALDRLTAIDQEQQRALDRTAQLPDGYTGAFDPTLPTVITGSTVLAFNAGATAFEIGPTTAAISGAAAAAAAAAVSANAAAASAAAAATSYDDFDDRYLGQKATDPTLDNDGDALLTGALYFNTSNNVMMVYTGSAWVRTTPTSGDQTNIDAVTANATNINTVAGIAADVTTTAGISANVTTVAGISANTSTVAGISANVTTVAGISANVTTVAGIAGDVSAVAAQVVGYDFSTTTAMADPGSGNVRFNNATLASVSAIAIDDLDKNGVDQSAYVALWDDSTSTVKGTLVFRTVGGDVATFLITGLTDNVGWSQVAVTHVASSGTFGNGEDTYIGFSRSGDAGDITGPASATDNAIARYDGTSGKLLQNSGVTVDDSGNATISGALSAGTFPQLAASSGASLVGYQPAGTGAVATTVQAKLRDTVSVKDFGAVGDASNDDTAAIQAAIDSLTSATYTGGILFFPPGFYKVTAALTITKGITVFGSGVGSASGTGNSGGTVIRSTAEAGDVFTVSSEGGVVFDNFTIDATVVKSASTAGIRIQGAAGAGTINRRSKITNVTILNMCDGVVWDTASDIVMQGCVIQDYTNVGIHSKQDGGTDSGQSLINGCLIWDLNVGTSQACIRYDKGGDLKIVGNKLLGSDYGFRMVLDDGPTGTLLFSSNSFEQQNVYCAIFSQGVTGKTFANVAMVGNQFSVLSPINAQGAISIVAGISANWISNVVISDNVFNMGCTTAQPHISLQDGGGMVIANNVMTNLGNAGPTAISTGGNVSGAQVLDNDITGYPTGLYSAGIDADTVIRDNNGLAFAALMGAKNGSEIYVTDGRIVGGGNQTVQAGGSGCTAWRMRGAWLSLSGVT